MGTRIDYSTVSHETIYQHITGGPGHAGMMDNSRGWQSVATKMQQFRGAVEQAVRGIGVAQQGAAADAATHSTSALMPWLEESVTAANGVAARVSEQAAAFAYTRDNMPPPRPVPEVSFRQDPATWTADHAIEWLPGIQTQNEAAHLAAQQDQERARELMVGYQGSSNDNLTARDHFASAPTVVAEVADPSPGGVGSVGLAVGALTWLRPRRTRRWRTRLRPLASTVFPGTQRRRSPQRSSLPRRRRLRRSSSGATRARRISRRPDRSRASWPRRHSGRPRRRRQETESGADHAAAVVVGIGRVASGPALPRSTLVTRISVSLTPLCAAPSRPLPAGRWVGPVGETPRSARLVAPSATMSAASTSGRRT